MIKIKLLNIIYTAKRKIRSLLTGSPHKRSVFDSLHSRFWRQMEPVVIIDVGAHSGESFRRFRGLFPNSTLHCIEADTENFSTLASNLAGQPNVYLENFGVGARSETRRFHKNVKSDTSSFIEVDIGSAWAKQRSALHKVETNSFTRDSYDVEIRTLDSYLEEKGIEHVQLLKIDTQGFEDEVLLGAHRMLKDQRVDVIETELIIGSAYKKSLTFSDLENKLLPLGYRLFAINRGGNLLDKPALSFNLIYVSGKFMDQLMK